MKMKRTIAVSALLFLILALCAVFAACEPETPPPAHEFVFTGSEEINGTEYGVTVTGDEGVFTLTIAELPALEITGTYKFVAQKGYKLYFNDAGDTLTYTKYDNANKEFTFKYNLDLGAQFGSGQVLLKCRDEDFAYDGTGLGLPPPTFTGKGEAIVYGSPIYFNASLVGKEDGTCALTTDVFIIANRSGTYIYDIAANEFAFTLEPQGDAQHTEYVSVYDAATDTFTVTAEVSSSYFGGKPAAVTLTFAA